MQNLQNRIKSTMLTQKHKLHERHVTFATAMANNSSQPDTQPLNNEHVLILPNKH